MTGSEAVSYWLQSAKNNLKVAKATYRLKHYSWSLFIWHLILEKVLKGIIVSQGKTPPPVHNLRLLAKIAGLRLTRETDNDLKEITTFNLEARYDDYKKGFEKKATKKYTQKWIKICQEVYQWLLRSL